MLHIGFDDPPKLAEAMLDDEETLAIYRRVRNHIRASVETGSLTSGIRETKLKIQ